MNSLFSFLIAPRVTEKFASARVKISLSPFPSFVLLYHGCTNIYVATNNAFQLSFVLKKKKKEGKEEKERNENFTQNLVNTIIKENSNTDDATQMGVYITRAFAFKDIDRSYTFYLYIPCVHANTL